MKARRYIKQATLWPSFAVANGIFFPNDFAGLAAFGTFEGIGKTVARTGYFGIAAVRNDASFFALCISEVAHGISPMIQMQIAGRN